MNFKKLLYNRRLWIALIGFIFCALIITRSDIFSYYGDIFSIQRGLVLNVDNSLLSPDPSIENLYLGRQIIEVEILTGEFVGQRFRIENTLSRFFNYVAQENMEMIFHINVVDGQVFLIHVFGHSRDGFIFGFIGFFALILIIVGKQKGLYSLLALMFTLSVVAFFMIPLIIEGHNPIVAAIITAVLTTVFSILLVSDVSLQSAAAIGGTVAGVAIAGAIGLIAGRFAHISGMHMQHAQELIVQQGMDGVIRLPLLLFAGIIIASLGAVMDVGVTIASSVFEMKRVNPSLSIGQLYKSGMNIGRDIIGTMSNTLILAFAGSSITVMVIIALYQLPYIRFINLDMLAVEVIQGLSASIGLVLVVPITAFFAAFLAAGKSI
ncbi:MAG: YibE/F family protein [Defluviitaleaceae bacterium]|nr:YibE/F family protein [Defluviitaleaceae bacterium]